MEANTEIKLAIDTIKKSQEPGTSLYNLCVDSGMIIGII